MSESTLNDSLAEAKTKSSLRTDSSVIKSDDKARLGHCVI